MKEYKRKKRSPQERRQGEGMGDEISGGNRENRQEK